MRDRPGGLPRERTVSAWADLYRSIVTIQPPPTGSNPGQIDESKATHGPR